MSKVILGAILIALSSAAVSGVMSGMSSAIMVAPIGQPVKPETVRMPLPDQGESLYVFHKPASCCVGIGGLIAGYLGVSGGNELSPQEKFKDVAPKQVAEIEKMNQSVASSTADAEAAIAGQVNSGQKFKVENFNYGKYIDLEIDWGGEHCFFYLWGVKINLPELKTKNKDTGGAMFMTLVSYSSNKSAETIDESIFDKKYKNRISNDFANRKKLRSGAGAAGLVTQEAMQLVKRMQEEGIDPIGKKATSQGTITAFGQSSIQLMMTLGPQALGLCLTDNPTSLLGFSGTAASNVYNSAARIMNAAWSAYGSVAGGGSGGGYGDSLKNMGDTLDKVKSYQDNFSAIGDIDMSSLTASINGFAENMGLDKLGGFMSSCGPLLTSGSPKMDVSSLSNLGSCGMSAFKGSMGNADGGRMGKFFGSLSVSADSLDNITAKFNTCKSESETMVGAGKQEKLAECAAYGQAMESISSGISDNLGEFQKNIATTYGDLSNNIADYKSQMANSSAGAEVKAKYAEIIGASEDLKASVEPIVSEVSGLYEGAKAKMTEYSDAARQELSSVTDSLSLGDSKGMNVDSSQIEAVAGIVNALTSAYADLNTFMSSYGFMKDNMSLVMYTLTNGPMQSISHMSGVSAGYTSKWVSENDPNTMDRDNVDGNVKNSVDDSIKASKNVTGFMGSKIISGTLSNVMGMFGLGALTSAPPAAAHPATIDFKKNMSVVGVQVPVGINSSGDAGAKGYRNTYATETIGAMQPLIRDASLGAGPKDYGTIRRVSCASAETGGDIACP